MTIQNSIIHGNSTGIDGGVTHGNSHTNTIRFSHIQQIESTANGNVPGSEDPMFVAPVVPGLSTAGDYRLKDESPLINLGNNLFNDQDFDLAGSPRINYRLIDLGAFENSADTFALSPSAGGIIFVSEIAVGKRNGSSWRHATDDLQMAMNTESVSEVWVSRGTYKPRYRADDVSGEDTDDPANSFVLKKDVKLFGGFAGTENSLAKRDLKVASNKTILSGDLGIEGDDSDNAIHVVISAGDVGVAELNGFTIRDGTANKESGPLLVHGHEVNSQMGGGLVIVASSPQIKNVIVSANKAVLYGGGIVIHNSSSVLTNVTVSGNQGYEGAGIDVRNSNPIIINALISGNLATDNAGGGIRNVESTTKIVNATISGNKAAFGGGVYNWNSNVTIQNSIVYGNNSGVLSESKVGSSYTTVKEHSLIQSIASWENGNLSGSVNPRFRAPLSPGLNAGGDYRLQSSSPVINRGNNLFNDQSYDLVGNDRVLLTTIDLGAYESENWSGPLITPDARGIVYVTESGGGIASGSDWENATSDLQKAINADGVKQVWVAKGTYRPIYSPVEMLIPDSSNIHRQNSFLLKKDVKVFGGFAGTENDLTQRDTTLWTNPSVLSGKAFMSSWNNSGHIVISAGDVGTAELNGFSVTEAVRDYGGSYSVNGQTVSLSTGGAVSLLSSSPVLKNLHIYNNQVFLSGGGLYLMESSPVIDNVVLENNSTMEWGGGGIYIGANSQPQISNIIARGNEARAGGGGGICIASNQPIVIYNSLISGNTTGGYGSAILLESPVGNLELVNVTIAGNLNIPNRSSIAVLSNSRLEIKNSLIFGNSSGIIDGLVNLSVQHSLVQGLHDLSNGNLDGGLDPLFEEPLAPAKTTGGNYTLQIGSPGINRGNNDLNSSSTDLAGLGRIAGARIDLGAFENHHPLPVTVIGFFAAAEKSRTRLSWSTTMEMNNKEFIILRSNNGGSFIELGRVSGLGNSSLGKTYRFYDESPSAEVLYYKLQQLDFDGRITDLGTRAVRYNKQFSLQIYPNPVSERLTVHFNTGLFGRLDIMDINGRVVMSERLTAGERLKQLNVAHLLAGNYTIRLSGRGMVEVLKFVKQ